MDGKLLTAPFEKIGARAKAFVVPRLGSGRLVRLDVRTDARGEFYELLVLPHVALCAVDVRPDMRHLLLHAADHSPAGDGQKHKFLCGHDERHWFVAGVPQVSGVSNVRTAMEALKPQGVRQLQERAGVRPRDVNNRRNGAFVRQGEWFFVKPAKFDRSWFNANKALVRRNEPLQRGGGKAHIAQFAFRFGGEVWYTSRRFPSGLSNEDYNVRIRKNPELRNEQWVVRRRNPDVYVRGRISHPDHATITLDDWHQVLVNEEWKAPAMQHIAFID